MSFIKNIENAFKKEVGAFKAFATRIEVATKAHAVHFAAAVEAKAKDFDAQVVTGVDAAGVALTKDAIARLQALSKDFNDLASHIKAKAGV